MPTISRFQISAIWIESNLALLDDPPTTAVPDMAYLGQPAAYSQRFTDAQHRLRHGAPQPPATPWTKTKGQRFWYYYLRGTENVDVTGEAAWQWLVPLRSVIPANLRRDEAPEAFSLVEAFLYPHAIALVATVSWQRKNGAALDEIVAEAFRLRYERIHCVQWLDRNDFFREITWPAADDAPSSLAQIGDHGLRILRARVFGPDAQTGKSSAKAPFTVATMLSGQDINLQAAPTNNGDIQRALHALAQWKPVHPGAAPLKLNSEVSLGLGKLAGTADLLYGQRRGRVIWYPSKFTTSGARLNMPLVCYHRNLVLATMQLESLYSLAQAVEARHRDGVPLSPFQNELARSAASKLGLLYGGHRDTYRSRSLQKQIEQNGWIDTINYLRRMKGMRPLHT
jgi:hypothetical protein